MHLEKTDLRRKLRVVMPMLFFLVIYLIFFFLIERIDATSYYVPEVPLDHKIPFIPAFIIPYVLWFPWIPFICLWALFTDEKAYVRISRFLMIGMSLFILISFLFPTKLNLRPENVPGDDICSAMVRYLHKIDTPTNVFPSIHVYDTLVLLYGVFIGECKLFRSKVFRAFTVTLTILICLATCFLKQHSILDGIAAVILLLLIIVIYNAAEGSGCGKKIQLALKRLFDIFAGIIGSVIALILILILGPIIKAQSPGPIIFTQERVGKNGKHFRAYKLRSMQRDADAHRDELNIKSKVKDGLMLNVDFDPRIIGNKILPDGTRKRGFGEFLRKTSLDEFPQFFNVLIGNMSTVGPRPPTLDEYAKYSEHHRERLAVKPGITGLWQVSGRSEITDFEEVVRLDTEYIHHWNLLLDLKILIKTIFVVITRKGSK